MYLGGTREACLQSPTDTYPSAQEMNTPGSLGKNQSTHQSDRRRSGGTVREERCKRPLTVFCPQSLLSTYYGTQPSVCRYRTEPHPSGAYAVQLSPSQNWRHIAHLPQKLLFDHLSFSQKCLHFNTDTIEKPSQISGRAREPGRREGAFLAAFDFPPPDPHAPVG